MRGLTARRMLVLAFLALSGYGGAGGSASHPCEEVQLADLKQASEHYAAAAKTDGPEGLEARTQASLIAGHFSSQGELEKAREWYTLALSGSSDLPLTTQEAAACQGLGWVLGRSGQAKEGVPYLSRAAEAWNRLLGPGSACEGIAREQRANCFMMIGRYEEALSEYGLSLDILAESLGEDASAYLRARHGLANALAFQGRLEEALPHYYAVSEARHRLLNPDDPLLAWICHDLALALHGLGRALEAQPFYREAMESRQDRFPDLYRQSALGLASCLTDRGDYLEARRILEDVLRSLEAEITPDPQSRAAALQSLASLRLRLRDYREASDLYQAAIATLGDALEESPHLEGLALSGLSQIALHQGKISLAETLQRRVLELRARLYGRESVSAGMARGKLAMILTAGGRTQEAEELFKKSLSQLAAHKGEAAFAYGEVSHDYAQMLWRSGLLGPASTWIDTTVSTFVASLPPGHVRRVQAYETAGEIHLAAGDRSRAWKEAVTAEEEGRRLFLLNIQGLSETSALLYKQTAPRGISVLLSCLNEAASPSPAQVQAVWESLIQSRNAVNKELANRRRAARDPQTQVLWDTIRSERQQLGHLYAQGPLPEKERAYFRTITELERRVERLEEQLALLSPAPRVPGSTDLSTLREALPERSALVAFVCFKDALQADSTSVYGAFVLSKDLPSARFVSLCSADSLATLIDRFQSHMESAASVLRLDPQAAEAEYQTIGLALRKLIWDPLKGDLLGLTTVYLIPEGDIWRINLPALPSEAGGYLIESAPAIRVMGSESDLLAPEHHRARSGALILGGIDYGPCGKDTARSLADGSSPDSFSSLPNSSQEALAVASIWTRSGVGGQSTSLLGSDAREEQVRLYGERVGVIHLATHGFFPRPIVKEGTFIRVSQWAGIALAGANVGGCSDDEDGILTASELSMLQLDGVRLVFLSSCGSGLGTLVPTEGVMGFQRSLRVAGCRSMVLSLWDLPDRPAREWVERFYTHYLTSPLSATAAHRIACTETLDVRRSLGRSTHPYYWGGFAVIDAVD